MNNNEIPNHINLFTFGDGLLSTFEDADGYVGSGYPNAIVLYEFGKYYAEHQRMHKKDPNHNCAGCTNDLDVKALQALKIAAVRAYTYACHRHSDDEDEEPTEQPINALLADDEPTEQPINTLLEDNGCHAALDL